MVVDVFQINPETQEITARGTLNNFTNNTLPSVGNNNSDTTTRFIKKCKGVLQGIEREILSIQSNIDYHVKEKNEISRKKSSINPMDSSDDQIVEITQKINSLQEELNAFTPQQNALNQQILDATTYRNNQFKFQRINQYLFWVKEAFYKFRNIIHGTNGDYPYREDTSDPLYKGINNNITELLDNITDDRLYNKSQLHSLEALFSNSHFLPV
jgi:DNA repair exonuclease SbcCD ATPase subunit